MRILGIGDYLDLGSLYMRLIAEGHEVRVFVAEADSRDVLAGLVPQVAAWEPELPWVRAAGDDGLIIFEETGRGALQDRLRAEGYRVIGGSALGDRLEVDRAYGQQVLASAGLGLAPSREFADFAPAIAYVRAHPGRYVLKFCGGDLPPDGTYVGMRDDGADMVAMLRFRAATWAEDYDDAPAFILMDHVRGVETGVGAMFDGREFVGPINLDWEHKRLFAGDLGEMTGEMGTVVSYRDGDKVFAATLAGLAPRLREAGHVGYVNLNTIINADGIWPLEFTCRFGYPGFAILSALFDGPCAEVLRGVATGAGRGYPTHPGYAVGVVLVVPPFPHHHGYDELSRGMHVCLPDDLTDDERRHLHYGELALVDGALVTAGQVGFAMVATGRGATIEAARAAAYALAGRIALPNVRYRIDIGDALARSGHADLVRWGWLTAAR